MPLVANDNSWAICMPKKTGSQSLVAMLCADGANVASLEGEWHGCEWNGEGWRLMIVRNPYERLASMFWFSLDNSDWLRGPADASRWLVTFLEGFRQMKSAHVEWVIQQAKMAKQFRPDKVFRLEDGLAAVLHAVGVSMPVQHRNPTAGKHTQRLPFAETFRGISSGLRRELDLWCLPDMEAWY